MASRKSDFAGAFAILSKKISWRHHGRTPEGIDCAGLIFQIYRDADHCVDHLDFPYSEEDAKCSWFIWKALDRLENEFRDVTQAVICGVGKDGDILALRNHGTSEPHLGILCGDLVYEMRARLHKTSLKFCSTRIYRAYRMKELCNG